MPTTPFTSSFCHGCQMAIETWPPTMHVPKDVTKLKANVTCLRCGNVWGPFEITPMAEWDKHGHNAFDQEERN